MRMKNLANKITVLRMILVPVFLALVYTGHRYIGCAVFIIASLSDLADGIIARKYNQITVFGKFMDPLADKVLVLSAMCWLIESGQLPGWVVAIVLLREFAVSGMRLVAAGNNNVIAAGWSGKVKTASTMVAIILVILFPIKIHNIAAAVVIAGTTVYSGIEYFIVNKHVFTEEKKQ